MVRDRKVDGTKLKLRMMLIAENAPLNHIVEETIDFRCAVAPGMSRLNVVYPIRSALAKFASRPCRN
jgi:hypothetical protein